MLIASPMPSLLMSGPAQAGALDYWTAIGTVGAVVVALTFGVAELIRSRRERASRRREQAQHVAAWREVFVSGPRDSTDEFGVQTHLVNTSSLPVYNARFYYWSFSNNVGDWIEDRWAEIALLPGQHVKTDWERQPTNPGGGGPVEVTFRDAAGRWWRRDTSGALDEIAGDPPRR